jgi:dGTPase
LLEQRYDEHPGLNLSYEVREGIAKHDPRVTVDLPEFHPELQPTLEATLVDIADEIAYNSHDIDDGLSSGIITFEMLYDSPIAKAFAIDPGSVESHGKDSSRYALVRKLINRMVTDVIDETDRRVRKMKVASLDDVRKCTEPICCYSKEMSDDVYMLKTFLQQNLYHHQRMTNMSDWAKEIIETLFNRFKADPSLMPERFQERLEKDGEEIVIADYIAGMTDRYAIKMYERVG